MTLLQLQVLNWLSFSYIISANLFALLFHFLLLHFSAKRGIAIACRLSVRLSVCLSVPLSVTLVNCENIGWNSSKNITPLVSLGRSLCASPT